MHLDICKAHTPTDALKLHKVLKSYGVRERSVQGAGGETRGEETAGETKAWMGG